jgi:hypothetical protein
MEASGQLHTPDTLLPGIEPQYPLEGSLDGLCSWSKCGGRVKKIPSLPMLGIEAQLSSLRPSHYADRATPTLIKFIHTYRYDPND